jgi:hypothetical protein
MNETNRRQRISGNVEGKQKIERCREKQDT